MEDRIIKKLEEHDKRFNQLDKQLDSIVKEVLDHNERFERIEETMATKEDISNISNTLNELVGPAKKKDQELTFMGEQVKRVENDVKKIKPLVGLN